MVYAKTQWPVFVDFEVKKGGFRAHPGKPKADWLKIDQTT